MSVLHAKSRVQGPASQLKQLRKEGFVPIALIDNNRETVLIKAQAREARAAIAGAGGIGRLTLKIEGEQRDRNVIIKYVDLDTLLHQLVSVTLAEVREDEKIKVDLEVTPIGVPAAVAEGAATLTQPTSHVKLRGKVSDLPQKFEVDVSGMELHHAFTAHDLELPEGVELLSSPDATLFSVQLIKAAHEAVEEVLAEGEVAATAEAGEEA